MKKLIKSISNTTLYSLTLSLVFIALGGSPIISFLAAFLFVETLAFVVPKGVIGADVYSDTLLQTARSFIRPDFNKKFQLRPQITNLLDIFLADREFTIPNLSALRSSTTRGTEALYLKKKNFTIATSKGCSGTGEQSGSAKVALTWNYREFKVGTSWKQHAGNEVSMAVAFANDLYNAENSLWEAIDQVLLTYLETNKSGVNNGGSGTFDSTNDIMWVAQSKKNRFYNLVMSDMQMNGYNPTFLEAHGHMWTAEQQYLINQASQNSVNTAFQFVGFEHFPSNLILPATIGGNTFESINWMVPTGGVAFVDWNDPLNRAGKVSSNKTWGTYQSKVRPQFTFDLFKKNDCADTTSQGGDVQDFTEDYFLGLNFAIAKQPVPVASETPIYKYGIADDSVFVS